jgi:hypothetical protein
VRLFAAAGVVAAVVAAARLDARIRYFGYEGGGEDDSSLAATAAYTNIAVTDGIDGVGSGVLAERLARMRLAGVRAMIELTSVLFEPSADGWSYRADAPQRWAAFVEENALVLDADHVACFYVMNEPTWNRVPPADVDRAARLVKGSFPAIPTAIVEAWLAVGEAVPPSVDWAGIDEYAIRNPAVDPVYQAALAALRKSLAPGQKIIYVLDGWWAAGLHGAAGIAPEDLADIASRWYDLARSDPDAVLLAVFTWPSSAGYLGTRDLPAAVRSRHAAIGRAILGRGNVAPVRPSAPVLVRARPR